MTRKLPDVSLVYPQRPGPGVTKFYLRVPYNNQVDNSPNKGQGPGWRHCNVTSAAMIAEYLKPPLWDEYRDFANGAIDTLNKVGGDTTHHEAITNMLNSIGIESYFSYTASTKDVSLSLSRGIPVLFGQDYKADGHMAVFIGQDSEGFWGHCPYGDRRGTSDEWNAIGGDSGKFQFYSWNWLHACFTDLGPERGWARFITSVDGRPTGIPTGL